MKFASRLASGLILVTLAITPFAFAPTAHASGFSRGVYGPNESAERSAFWGANGAAECASGVRYGSGFAGGCGSSYYGENGSYHGYHANSYNAQTGSGYHTADRNATYNGSSYGYDTQTNYTYTKGNGMSGSTSINTQNNGSYTCSFSTQSGCSH